MVTEERILSKVFRFQGETLEGNTYEKGDLLGRSFLNPAHFCELLQIIALVLKNY